MGILNTYTQTKNTTTLLSDLGVKNAKIAVVGLQNESLATALYLATKYRVIGYDNNRDHISLIQQQKDPAKKIAANKFIGKDFFATSISNLLETAQFFIITEAKHRLNEVNTKEAVVAVAKHLKVGDVVVFQNNCNSVQQNEVYINILERLSGLLNSVDFTIAFTRKAKQPKFENSFFPTVFSSQVSTRKLVEAVFQNIPILTVVKRTKLATAQAVANKIEKALKIKQPLKKTYSVLLKGITSKKNSSELENSKAIELYMALYRKGIQVKVQDNHILSSKLEAYSGIELTTTTSQRFDAIVNAVEHDNYQAMTKSDYKKNSTLKTLYFDKSGDNKA